jgi:hypothetical protein
LLFNDIDSKKNQRVKETKNFFIAHTDVREQHSTIVEDLFCLVLVRLLVDIKLGHQI